MPTQIPPGSGLAVRVKSPKFKRRRAFSTGPKRLIYADGGLVEKPDPNKEYTINFTKHTINLSKDLKQKIGKEIMDRLEAMERRRAAEAAMNASMRKERAAKQRIDARKAEDEYLEMMKEEDETLPAVSPLRRTPHLRET